MVDRLVVPSVLAGVHVQRHHRLCEELLAVTPDVAVVRHRVPDADIDEAERRIDGERCPDGTAADVRALLRPRVGAELLAGRDQVELPLDLTGLGVEGEDLGSAAPKSPPDSPMISMPLM